MRQLAPCLTSEWKILAEELGLRVTRIQAIQRNHMQGSTEEMVMDMLLTWVKKMPTSCSKVGYKMRESGEPSVYFIIAIIIFLKRLAFA